MSYFVPLVNGEIRQDLVSNLIAPLQLYLYSLGLYSIDYVVISFVNDYSSVKFSFYNSLYSSSFY